MGKAKKLRPKQTAEQRENAKRIGAEMIAGLDELLATLKAEGPKGLDKYALPLPPLPVGHAEVKAAREALKVSPRMFALCLCATLPEVEAWEAGHEPVPDMARRLIDEIRHDPAYWRARLGLVSPTG